VTSYYGSNLTALQQPPFQGNYFIKTTDTTSADNGGTIIVDAAGNRWYLSYNNLLTVAQFGADPTQSDSTSYIQSAINALQSGEILDGCGIQYTVVACNLQSNMTLQNINFLTKAGSTPSQYASPVTVGANGSTALIQNVNIYNVNVNGNRVNNQTGSIGYAEDGAKHGFRFIGNLNNINLINCSATYCGSYGFFFYRGLNTATIPFNDIPIIQNVRMSNCVSQWNKAHGLAFDSVNYLQIDNCNFTYNGLAYLTDPSGKTSGGAAYGNGIDAEGYGIGSWNGNVTITNTDCRFNGCGSIYIQDPVLTTDSRFQIRGPFYLSNIQMDSGSDSTRLNPLDALVITAPAANWSLGNIYNNITVENSTANGEVFISKVQNSYLDILQTVTGTRLGQSYYTTNLSVNSPSPYQFVDSNSTGLTYLYAQPEIFTVSTDGAGTLQFNDQRNFGLQVQVCTSAVVAFAANQEQVVTATLPKTFANRFIGAVPSVAFVSATGQVYTPRSASGTSTTVQCLVLNGATAQNIRIQFVCYGQ